MTFLTPDSVALFLAGAMVGTVFSYIAGMFAGYVLNVDQNFLRCCELQVISNNVLDQQTKNQIITRLYVQSIKDQKKIRLFYLSLFILIFVITLIAFTATMNIDYTPQINSGSINLTQNFTTVGNYYYQNTTYNVTNILHPLSIEGLKCSITGKSPSF